MAKKNRAFFKRFSKYFDTNIIWQAVFGAASIICAIAVCFFDRSLATFFDVMKDIFGTLMVFVVFAVAIHHFRERFSPKKDKLDYIDFWDDHKDDIYSDDITSFLKPMVCGLPKSRAPQIFCNRSERSKNQVAQSIPLAPPILRNCKFYNLQFLYLYLR